MLNGRMVFFINVYEWWLIDGWLMIDKPVYICYVIVEHIIAVWRFMCVHSFAYCQPRRSQVDEWRLIEHYWYCPVLLADCCSSPALFVVCRVCCVVLFLFTGFVPVSGKPVLHAFVVIIFLTTQRLEWTWMNLNDDIQLIDSLLLLLFFNDHVLTCFWFLTRIDFWGLSELVHINCIIDWL